MIKLLVNYHGKEYFIYVNMAMSSHVFNSSNKVLMVALVFKQTKVTSYMLSI